MPTRFRIPMRANGTALWRQSPEFIDWFQQQCNPAITNRDLQDIVEAETGIRPTLNALQSLRSDLHLLQIPGHAQTQARLTSHQKIRELGPKDKEHYVTVTGDAIVASDWHIPYHDESLVDRLCQVATRLQIPNLVINGDFLNQDAFSKWRGHAFHMPWGVEKDVARQVVQRLCGVFQTIYYIMDNHDRRIIWANDRPNEFTEGDVIDLIAGPTERGKIRASIYYHHCIVNDTWRITSPKEYRRAKLSLPNRLAQVYHQHIISGGDHLFGLGFDDSGRYVIANNASMVNQAEVPYVTVQDTSYPHWNRGFYAIVQNTIHPFIDHPLLWPTWWESIDVAKWRGRNGPKKPTKK